MKMKFLFIITLVLIPLLNFAQGVITVFSEDGDKFFLVLNGVKQNTVAQTNVRVDGLTNEFYSGKIIFEDQTKPEITKMMNTKDAGNGQWAEVTFKIKKTKDGTLKLRYFGITPVPENYNPPPDMYVAHYGQPAPQPTVNTVSQTTVTTTNNLANPNSVNMNVGAGGANLNVNVSDPNNGNGGVSLSINMTDPNTTASIRQTTTTTTTNTYSNSAVTNDINNNTQTVPAGCQVPMDFSNFNAAKATISKSSFEETKLSTAKSVLSSNCVSSDQVVQICGLFNFEESKLNFAKFAYSKTTDKGNYFKVVNVFTFETSKTDLNNFINNGGR